MNAEQREDSDATWSCVGTRYRGVRNCDAGISQPTTSVGARRGGAAKNVGHWPQNAMSSGDTRLGAAAHPMITIIYFRDTITRAHEYRKQIFTRLRPAGVSDSRY